MIGQPNLGALGPPRRGGGHALAAAREGTGGHARGTGADLDLPGDQANGHEELNRGLEQLLSPTSGGGVHICASRVARQPATLNKATRKSNEPHADSLDWHRNGGDGFQRKDGAPRV